MPSVQSKPTLVATGCPSHLNCMEDLKRYTPADLQEILGNIPVEAEMDIVNLSNLAELARLVGGDDCQVVKARKVTHNGVVRPTQGWTGRLLQEAKKRGCDLDSVYDGTAKLGATAIVDIGTTGAKLTLVNNVTQTIEKKTSQVLFDRLKAAKKEGTLMDTWRDILNNWLQETFEGIDVENTIVFATGDFREFDLPFVISQHEEASYIATAVKTAYAYIGIHIDWILDIGTGSMQILKFNPDSDSDKMHFSSRGLKALMAEYKETKKLLEFVCTECEGKCPLSECLIQDSSE